MVAEAGYMDEKLLTAIFRNHPSQPSPSDHGYSLPSQYSPKYHPIMARGLKSGILQFASDLNVEKVLQVWLLLFWIRMNYVSYLPPTHIIGDRGSLIHSSHWSVPIKKSSQVHMNSLDSVGRPGRHRKFLFTAQFCSLDVALPCCPWLRPLSSRLHPLRPVPFPTPTEPYLRLFLFSQSSSHPKKVGTPKSLFILNCFWL